jgi:hypothetical protein
METAGNTVSEIDPGIAAITVQHSMTRAVRQCSSR